MDILIKNNVIKKNKIIVDIGIYATRILDVRYASKKIIIDKASMFENTSYDDAEGINFDDIARKVDDKTNGRGKRDISVSLPAEICENKIVAIRNKRDSDIPKIIEKEHMDFANASRLTHVIDYAFLGKREEQGDTVAYYLISAVQKTVANDLVNAFAEHKMKVTTIVSSMYNQICLSELYFDDYENMNRMFIDIGSRTTRVIAFAEGVPIYARTIEYGFKSYVNLLFKSQSDVGKPDIITALNEVGEMSGLNVGVYSKYFYTLDKDLYKSCLEDVDGNMFREIDKIVDVFSSNDVAITKIYLTGHIIEGFRDKLKNHTDMECECVTFNDWDEKDGKNYLLWVEDAGFKADYSNAVGLAINPMM